MDRVFNIFIKIHVKDREIEIIMDSDVPYEFTYFTPKLVIPYDSVETIDEEKGMAIIASVIEKLIRNEAVRIADYSKQHDFSWKVAKINVTYTGNHSQKPAGDIFGWLARGFDGEDMELTTRQHYKIIYDCNRCRDSKFICLNCLESFGSYAMKLFTGAYLPGLEDPVPPVDPCHVTTINQNSDLLFEGHLIVPCSRCRTEQYQTFMQILEIRIPSKEKPKEEPKIEPDPAKNSSDEQFESLDV